MPLAQGIETATVAVYPRAAYSLKIPGSSDESPAELDWAAFNDSRGVAGNTHLSAIIYEIIGAFLPDQFDAKNDYLFQTPDHHTYRVILVRYEKFGDGRSEFIFNLIETLVPLQGGDPRTTLITSAIVMATQFRSLFIESDATYNTNKLAAIDGLSDTAKDLLRDLRRVRIESATLQVTETKLAEALGEGERVHNWNTQWWPPVRALEVAAQEFIDDTSAINRTGFLDALKKMIETTCDINRQFTSLCLKVYKEIIDKN
jgi:hypothetical protein